jgi:hypothetical protein
MEGGGLFTLIHGFDFSQEIHVVMLEVSPTAFTQKCIMTLEGGQDTRVG